MTQPRPSKPKSHRGRRRSPETATLPFHRDGKWGGYRPGSGRKPLPASKRSGVPHRERARLASRYPIHATVRIRKGLPPLRNQRTKRLLQKCFAAACERAGFRLVHYSIQSSHLHLLCEGTDRKALSRGMQGLLIRVAKALNKLWQRRGSVFAERYHEHILRTPREVRNAVAYVLNNLWRHIGGVRLSARSDTASGLDGFASGLWFDGWRHKPRLTFPRSIGPPVARPHTWLLEFGWRRCGLIRVDEVPRGLWRPRG
jgi:REP-associated tyrosine transposase